MNIAAKTTDELVAEFLVTCNVSFSVRYVQETIREEKWKCDEWRVTLKSGRIDSTSEYFTGLGHRKLPKFVFGQPAKSDNTAYARRWREDNAKPVAPSSAGVLYSLIRDGEAIDQSFTDWCSDLGYDEDSRKALQTYDECCKSGQKLRKLFNPAQRAELATLLQDY